MFIFIKCFIYTKRWKKKLTKKLYWGNNACFCMKWTDLDSGYIVTVTKLQYLKVLHLFPPIPTAQSYPRLGCQLECVTTVKHTSTVTKCLPTARRVLCLQPFWEHCHLLSCYVILTTPTKAGKAVVGWEGMQKGKIGQSLGNEAAGRGWICHS